MQRHRQDEVRSRLYEVAVRQSGHFSARQALEAGYSRRLQHYHVSRGHWLRIDRAIYRLKEFPPGRYEDLVRWTLWSRGQAVVSHESAAAVHGLGDLLPSRVELTVPPGFRKRVPPGVRVHRAPLSGPDAEAGEGFRVTTPLRTLLDLFSSGTEPDWLRGVLADALARGAVRKPALLAGLENLEPEARARAHRLLGRLEGRDRAV